jgi:hypothetical protein
LIFGSSNLEPTKMESPIEVLSDDVLLEVFEFLDAKSLKKAALVCRKCENFIKNFWLRWLINVFVLSAGMTS